jgi:hypothetical protein
MKSAEKALSPTFVVYDHFTAFKKLGCFFIYILISIGAMFDSLKATECIGLTEVVGVVRTVPCGL